MPTLTVFEADQIRATRTFSVATVIGRSPECELPIDHALLSRRHLRISPSAEGWDAQDLGSTNGTWIDGERVTSHLLADGDVITIGDLALLFASEPAFSPSSGAADIVQTVASHDSRFPVQTAQQPENQPALETSSTVAPIVPEGERFGRFPARNWDELLMATPGASLPSTGVRLGVLRTLSLRWKSNPRYRYGSFAAAAIATTGMIFFYVSGDTKSASATSGVPAAGVNSQVQGGADTPFDVPV